MLHTRGFLPSTGWKSGRRIMCYDNVTCVVKVNLSWTDLFGECRKKICELESLHVSLSLNTVARSVVITHDYNTNLETSCGNVTRTFSPLMAEKIHASALKRLNKSWVFITYTEAQSIITNLIVPSRNANAEWELRMGKEMFAINSHQVERRSRRCEILGKACLSVTRFLSQSN